MKKEHISVIRRRHSLISLESRIEAMTAIVNTGEIPPEFYYYKSDDRIAKWENASLNISKISISTARDSYPKKWSEIQSLKASIQKIANKSKSKKSPIITKAKTKSEAIKQNQNSKKVISALTNELIMLRVAYMELLNAAEQDKHKNRVITDTIKRHFAHHGLQGIISNKK